MNSSLPPTPPKEYQANLQGYKPADPFIPPQARKAMENLPPEKAYKSAASNFYAIAVLSFLNSIISAFGGGFVFVIGLGITQLIDGIAYVLGQNASDSKLIFTAFALIFDLGACIAFALFGYFTSKSKHWAFVVGMSLYALDAILTLLFKDWIGFAFHLYFLWQLWMMYRILGYWRKLSKKPIDSFPQDIGVS